MVNQLSRMNEIIQSYVTDGQFIGAILLAQKGNLIIDKGYGSANLEWQIPNAPDTKFRLGSITKQFTAASILLLEERGSLKIDDMLSKHMTDTPPAWKDITIFHLLTHTSGIPNYTAFPNFNDFAATTKPVTPTEIIDLFINKDLNFEPGSQYDYCNSGYVILGYLIEKISGMSYQEFVVNNIFKKLGMLDSGYDSNSEIILRRASGYNVSQYGLMNTEYLNCCIPYSAGSLYSTTHDLLKWQQELFSGRVLTAASFNKMTTPYKDHYGLGVVIKTIDGCKLIGHGGGINGFKTNMVYSPDEDLLVIVLSNLITAGFVPQNIALKLVKLSRGINVIIPSERNESVVSPEILNRYIGTYDLSPTNKLEISIDDGNLMALVAYQPKIKLFPESETRFFSRIPDMQIEFLKDAQGSFTSLVLCQDEEDIKGTKSG
jgi:CubicO group peptidase (beta-lactamase class C family)